MPSRENQQTNANRHNDDNKEIKAIQTKAGFSFAFCCQRSGNCCARPNGVVRVRPEEIQPLAEFLGITVEGFRTRYLTVSGEQLIPGLGERCVFLRDGNTAACMVYPVRPERCRSWPFWPELKESPRALQEAMRLCPGIQASTTNETRP